MLWSAIFALLSGLPGAGSPASSEPLPAVVPPVAVGAVVMARPVASDGPAMERARWLTQHSRNRATAVGRVEVPDRFGPSTAQIPVRAITSGAGLRLVQSRVGMQSMAAALSIPATAGAYALNQAPRTEHAGFAMAVGGPEARSRSFSGASVPAIVFPVDSASAVNSAGAASAPSQTRVADRIIDASAARISGAEFRGRLAMNAGSACVYDPTVFGVPVSSSSPTEAQHVLTQTTSAGNQTFRLNTPMAAVRRLSGECDAECGRQPVILQRGTMIAASRTSAGDGEGSECVTGVALPGDSRAMIGRYDGSRPRIDAFRSSFATGARKMSAVGCWKPGVRVFPDCGVRLWPVV